jgi:FkbM family methyltransferase
MRDNLDIDIKYYRPGTDDEKYVIPQIIEADMYRFKGKLSKYLNTHRGDIIDCGAHIGVFSRICIEYMDTSCSLHSFEPYPDNFRLLCKNILPHAEKISNLLLYQKAVGLHDGQIRLYYGEDTGRFTCVPMNRDSEWIEVECINIFDYIARIDNVVILKMDLEGYESTILENAPDHFLDNVKLLVLEEHHLLIDHKRIREKGFRLWYNPNTGFVSKVMSLLNPPKRHYVYRRTQQWP